MRLTIKLVGIGGQGIVATGMILARAFFEEGYQVLQSQTYGAASRGALSSASVIVQDSPIMDLSFDVPDVLVLLSREGVKKHENMLQKPAMAMIDDMFRDTLPYHQHHDEHDNIVWIPASRLAMQHFDEPIMLNMIVLGALSRQLSSLVSRKTVIRHVAMLWPKWKERNIKGFEVGWNWMAANSSERTFLMERES